MIQKNAKQGKLKLCLIGDASSNHVPRVAKFFVDRGNNVHLVDDHDFRYKNLKLHYLKNCTGIKFLDYLFRLIRIKSIVKKINPDIIYCQQVTYHGFLGALSGVHPLVVEPWGSDILFDPKKSFVHRMIIKFVFDNADVIHYVDKSVINRVNNIYGNTKKKAFVLNEGADTKIFRKRKSSKKSKITILSLRALTSYYNPLLLIEALNIIINQQKCYNIECIMSNKGDANYKKLVRDAIKRYNLSEYIKFCDWIAKVGYVQKLMKNADIYVDTINRPVQGQGAGKTMLEAMSCELAVAMPDNPSIELYIKNMHNGLIYKRNDFKSLAKALSRLIKDEKLRLRMGKSARKFIVANLDWATNMGILEKKFCELAGQC